MRTRNIFLIILFLEIGCSTGTEIDKTDKSADSGKAGTESGTLKMVVYGNLPGVAVTETKETIAPTNEKLREAFDSIEWTATDQSNGVTLTQSGAHIINLGLKQHSVHGLLMQFSEHRPGQSKWSHLYANSMTTDDALKALLSFNSGNEDFRTLIDWKTEEEFEEQ